MAATKKRLAAAGEPNPAPARAGRKPAAETAEKPAVPAITDYSPEIQAAVQAASSKKAERITVLDLRHTPAFTDVFVLCTGQNARQVKAIVDQVEETLRTTFGQKPVAVEGYRDSEWVLVDYFDFVVHVFTPETREFYALERLWGSAVRVEYTDEPAGRPA
jgi:ribosome-associated protein